MNYLVVIHIPFAREPGGTVVTGDMWLRDLRGMAAALGPISVAAPCVDVQELSARGAGSFSMGRVAPDDPMLRFLPLPYYDSAKTLMRSLRSTRRLLNQYIASADVVHIDSGGWPIAQGQFGFLAARSMGKKIVLFLGDGADPIGRFKEKLARDRSPLKKFTTWALMKQFQSFFRDAARRADVTFFHNPVTAARFARHARQHHSFFRTFVDDSLLLTSEQLQEKTRRITTEQPLRLIMAGRLIAMKGVNHAIEALHRARGDGAAIELTLLGSGDEEERLRRLAAERQVTNYVHFRGTVPYGPQLFDILREHHALVVCNLTDEISRNILLALATGLALVSYDNPATRTLLAHRNNALVVPTGDVSALADAFHLLAKDRTLAARIIQGGYDTARRHTFEACHAARAQLIRAAFSDVPPHPAIPQVAHKSM